MSELVTGSEAMLLSIKMEQAELRDLLPGESAVACLGCDWQGLSREMQWDEEVRALRCPNCLMKLVLEDSRGKEVPRVVRLRANEMKCSVEMARWMLEVESRLRELGGYVDDTDARMKIAWSGPKK